MRSGRRTGSGRPSSIGVARVPGAIVTTRMDHRARSRATGSVMPSKYLLTGDSLSATEAERIGLITEVVPQAGLDEATYGLAARLAAGATRAIRWTKLTTNLPLRQLFHACFDTGIAYEMPSNATRDHAEAVAAFRDRRPPRFGR